MRSLKVLVTMVVALAGAGCGDQGADGDPCRRPPSAGTTTITLESGGITRRALLVVPPTDGAAPLPLVLALHGSFTTPEVLLEWSALDQAAATHGFVLAAPEAWLAGPQWNVPGVPLFGGDPVPEGSPSDVELARDLIDVVAAQVCIDPARVYATGFSGGGRLASSLGCELADRLAAIGPVAGLRFPDPCPAAGPLPVVSLHGTADTIDPYEGGGEAYWGYGVEEAAARWAAHGGCAATPTDEAVTAGVTRRTWGGCAAGAALELYVLDGTGHVWPGGPMETPPGALSANDVLWEFFAGHARP
jgi:polyhydroxybutyrate depolymerase